MWQLLLIFIVILVLFLMRRNGKLMKLYNQMPCDSTLLLPVIGHSYKYLGSGERVMESIKMHGEETTSKGGLMGLWHANVLYIMVTDADASEYILRHCLEKDDMLNITRVFIGNGSIYAPVSIWRHRRKMLAPSFKSKNLYNFVEVFSRQSRILTNDLQDFAGKGPVCLWEHVTASALTSIWDGQFKTFIDIMIEDSGDNQECTDLELQEEMLVLTVAGTDTSSVGIAFTLLMLANYPDVQEKVFQELQDVFCDSDRPLVVEDLPNLKYLEAVIKETLRLYPPGPVISRKVDHDVILPSGVELLKGCGVLVNIWGLHRNPKYWGSNAEEFKPERFLSPLTHPAAYIPFSSGPRNCVGRQYAYMSMKTVISDLLRRYRILPTPDPVTGKITTKAPLKIKYNFFLRHVDNCRVILENR